MADYSNVKYNDEKSHSDMLRYDIADIHAQTQIVLLQRCSLCEHEHEQIKLLTWRRLTDL